MSHPDFSFVSKAFFSLLLTLVFNFSTNSQWTPLSSGTQYPLLSVYFINDNTGFLSSNSDNIQQLIGGEIIKTTDGGLNWVTVLLDSNFRAKDFHFFDLNTGIAVGGSYSVQGFVFRTTNAGMNWVNTNGFNIQSHMFSISFPNNITGFAGAGHGVYKSTNSGINWEHILVLQQGFPTWGEVYFIDVNTGLYARNSGLIYKTTNSGANWQQILLGSAGDIYRDMKFIDNSTGFLCGDSGRMYKTTNQGLNWFSLNTGITGNIYGMNFPTANTGYASCLQYVIKTTDGGLNWFPVFNFSGQNMFSVYFINEETGYIAGDSGRVYKTTTGGVIGIPKISNEVPAEFLLYQNYPNPFNPNTHIKFAVSEERNVNITIFDLLGREIEQIVNENLAPGTYEVTWNAEKYSSGIYLYKILSGDYVSVRKMSFIK